MAIRKWHPGKLILLWSWGGVAAGFMLTDFLGRGVSSAPLLHLLEFLGVLLILLVLSAVTWHCLGGRELT
jgi:hypothetical protein